MIYILEESVMIYFPKKYLVNYVVEFFFLNNRIPVSSSGHTGWLDKRWPAFRLAR